MDWFITIKIIHILCVMGWMTSIFAVPRALIYWKREVEQSSELSQTGQLTIRLYRFSAGLGIIAIIAGLWLQWTFDYPTWTWVKLAVVTLLIAHYSYTGYLVIEANKGNFPKSDKFLRIFNEISVFAVIGILYLVVAQPF